MAVRHDIPVRIAEITLPYRYVVRCSDLFESPLRRGKLSGEFMWTGTLYTPAPSYPAGSDPSEYSNGTAF